MKTLTSIKTQLINHKALTLPQQKYLIDTISGLEKGIALDEIIEQTKITPIARGKQSVQYQNAMQLKKLKLIQAITFLQGSDWSRCLQLAGIVRDVKRKRKNGVFQPVDEIEQIIMQIINAGLPIPGTTRGLYGIIF